MTDDVKTPEPTAPPEAPRRRLSSEEARALAQRAWAKRRARQQAAQTEPEADALPGLVEIWDRRLITPDAPGSASIALKQPGMTVRWINTSITGRLHRAQHDQGWVPVRVAELQHPEAISDLVTSPDGLVRRGERGQEILHKMPTRIYEAIQQRKSELYRQRERKIRETLAQEAAQRLGSEAGDAVSRFRGDIKVGRETTEF